MVEAKFPFEFGFPPGCKRVEVKYIWFAEALYSAPESFRFGSERGYSVTLAVLQSRSGCRAHQITQPHQIVGRQCEGKHPAHSRHAAMTGLTQAGHGLEPARSPPTAHLHSLAAKATAKNRVRSFAILG